MSKQPLPEWLDVNEAAALAGKSVSTIRRLLPEIEAAAPDSIRREPVEGRGGERVLLSTSYLKERFNISEPEPLEEEGRPDSERGAGVVALLERVIVAKDRQIEALQRDGESKSRQLEEAQIQAGELTERLTQFAAINAGLQNKLLAINERAGNPAAASPGTPPAGDKGLTSPAYFVAVAVLASLIIGLLVYIALQWVGNG